jgi:hypothetical protein
VIRQQTLGLLTLIAWYVRHGYRNSGVHAPKALKRKPLGTFIEYNFPQASNRPTISTEVGTQNDLYLVKLYRDLASHSQAVGNSS